MSREHHEPPDWVDNLQSATDRLNAKDVLDDLNHIRSQCRVPSISVGVIHEGQVIYTGGVGFRDKDSEHSSAPDSESLFTLSSLSKAIISAAFGILLHEDRVQWSEPVAKYVSEFSPKGDRRVAEATFKEVLCHSSGIDNPVVSLLGPYGKVIVPQNEFIQVLNDIPTSRGGEPLYNRWMYSNVAYGLVAVAIERITGTSLAEFVQKNILDPLDMKNTAVTASQVEGSSNIAHSYARMESGEWKRLDHEWTRENNTPILGMIGMRSSVRDMLIFTAALLDSFRATSPAKSKATFGADKWPENAFDILSHVKTNPLKKAPTLLNGAYRWSPCHDGCGEEKFYHYIPWVRVIMPCCMLGWGSYNRTMGDWPPEADWPARNADTLGKESPQRLAFLFNGIGFGGSSSIKFFPNTRSIVVAFAGGLNVGDAADFASLLLVQKLFDLQPTIDILKMVRREVDQYLGQVDRDMADLEKHYEHPEPEADSSDYVGEYRGLGITLVVRDSASGNKLELCFNHREDLVFQLERHGKDRYSYGPKTRDEWLAGGWLDWDYYLVRILEFKRSGDPEDKVIGTTWVWEKGADPFFFIKTKDSAEALVNEGVPEEAIACKTQTGNKTILAQETGALTHAHSGNWSKKPEGSQPGWLSYCNVM